MHIISQPVRDRRRSPRRSSDMSGVIVVGAAKQRLPCVVRNISDGGAKLEIFELSSIPLHFELLVDGKLIACRLAWRGHRELGVEFEGR